MKEIWKDILGFEGLYQASNIGNVKSLQRTINHPKSGLIVKKEKIIKNNISGNGYMTVSLYKKGEAKTKYIHQIVAIAFLGHKPSGYKFVINHKNFNRKDNRLDNLEVMTQRENTNLKHIKISSNYVGVVWHKRDKIWESSIRINGRLKYLGRFVNEIDAHNAYQNKLRSL